MKNLERDIDQSKNANVTDNTNKQYNDNSNTDKDNVKNGKKQ